MALADPAAWQSVNRAAYERMAHDYFRRSEGAGIEADAVEFVSMLTARFGPRPRVLDIGSGPGVDSWRLSDAGAAPVCFDTAVGMLRAAGARSAPAALVCGDMLVSPFGAGSFHGAWACASLLHAPKPALPRALAEIRRILVGGGIVYLAMRAGRGRLIANQGTSLERVLARYSEDELEAALTESGLRALTLGPREWPLGLDGGKWIHGFAVRD